MSKAQYCTGSGCDRRMDCQLYRNHIQPMGAGGQRFYLKFTKVNCDNFQKVKK